MDFAYRVVSEWGFEPSSPVPWDQSTRRSPDTQQGIEDAVEEIVAVAREDVVDLMVQNRSLLKTPSPSYCLRKNCRRGRRRTRSIRCGIVNVLQHLIDLFQRHVRNGALAIIHAVAYDEAAIRSFHNRHCKLNPVTH